MADASGRATDDSLLQNGFTTAQLAGVILGSVEYDQDLVSGYYSRFLHRAADAAGLNADVSLLQNGIHGQQPIFASDPTGKVHRIKDEDIIAMILSSDEYYNLTQLEQP